jgi:hypothetical protein
LTVFRGLAVVVAALAAAIVVSTDSPALGSGATPVRVNGFIGGLPGGAGGSFVDPTDAAVLRDGSGGDVAIFVTEGGGGSNRVQRLDDDGNFELAWGRDVVRSGALGDRGRGFEVCLRADACQQAPPGGERGELRRPSGVAVAHRSGDVYVADSGNRRVQRFSAGGRPMRAWTVDVAGARGDASLPLTIAVSPSSPHDVFVGDQSTNRVLQFNASGRLLRVWGWGVTSRGRDFQVCEADQRCRAGRPVPGGGALPPRWPNHIAIDANGVLYGSTFLGREFESDQIRTRIERFITTRPPARGEAQAALLEPLAVDDGLASATPESQLLSNGATLGLDVSPTSGALLAINNPFGATKLDVVKNPGAPRRTRVSVADQLPFLQNVSGIALADRGRLVLLSSGTLHPRFGRSSFTGCAQPDSPHDCHGLIALADGRRADALLTGPPGAGTAWINPRGAARYQLQLSSDGQRWRDAGQPRLVTGTGYERVPLPATGPRHGVGAQMARLAVVKRVELATASTWSNVVLMGHPAPGRVAGRR